MDGQFQPVELPVIREHDFQSHLPVIGPLVQFARRLLYQLTAKWGVLALIHQQNQINQIVAQYLREYDARMIEMDRDLAYLSRTMAELELQQRQLARLVQSQASKSRTNIPATTE